MFRIIKYSISFERCRFYVFDIAFGVGENTFLANTAQSDVLRHSGPQTSASTIRNEGRVENAIGAKLAQSEDLTSGNPDFVYRAILTAGHAQMR